MVFFRIENCGSGFVWIPRLEIENPTHSNIHARIEKELDSCIVGFLNGDYSKRLDFKSQEVIEGGLICIMKLNKKLCKNCNKAAEKGDLECLRYAYEHGAKHNEFTTAFAASKGHLHCLKFMHEHGFPLNKTTCSVASMFGHLDCLKFLHENQCPWDAFTCTWAAKKGHLQCLQYAHENGCPLGEISSVFAENCKQYYLKNQ